MAIAREVIIGDEEPSVALAIVFADRLFEIVGVRNRLLRPWTLMIVQNEHW
jgi:hypothetical protein